MAGGGIHYCNCIQTVDFFILEKLFQRHAQLAVFCCAQAILTYQAVLYSYGAVKIYMSPFKV